MMRLQKIALHTILVLFISFILASGCLLAADLSHDHDSHNMTRFEVVAENEALVLFLDKESTEIALKNKRTGDIWYSNPTDWEREERIARGRVRNEMGAQVAVSYFLPGDVQRFMDSRNDSIAYGQYTITEVPSGIRIDYLLGKEWEDLAYLPVMISEDRLHSMIINRIDDKFDREFILENFQLVTLRPAGEGEEMPAIYGLDTKAVFGDYILESPGSNLSAKKYQTLVENLVDQIVGHREDMTRRAMVKHEDISQLVGQRVYVLKTKLASWDIEDMVELIKRTDYSPEDATEDHLQNNIDPPQPNIEVFRIGIIYTLEGENLIVEVPADGISYPENVKRGKDERVTIPLHSISVLKCFGAASKEESGYMLVPDGSGALINLNNGKLDAPPYRQPIYGEDCALMLKEVKNRIMEQSYLPVFGMKTGAQAFLAIIEEGEALANINADVAERVISYNTVYPEFIVIPRGETALQGNVPWHHAIGHRTKLIVNTYQSRIAQCNIRIRYAFLHGEEANYVGMGRYYHSYLQEKQGMTRLDPAENVPLTIELLGGVQVTRPILGKVNQSLTTYDEVAEIVSDLIEAGITNLKVRYRDCLTGGLPKRVRLETTLGNREGFARLCGDLRQKDVDLFLSVNFLTAKDRGLLDGFIARRDSSRFLNLRLAQVYDHNLATGTYDLRRCQYLVSPSRLDAVVDSFLADYNQYGLSTLSLGDMGNMVNSDFRLNEDLLIDRQQARVIILDQVQKMARDAKLAIMADGVNAFVLPWVGHIVNMPMESSNLKIEDAEVPFYQIAVHGLVPYAGFPANNAPDLRRYLLKCVEYGANPYFLWAYHVPAHLNDAGVKALYNTVYGRWLPEALSFYEGINAALQDIQAQPITNHERLQNEVYCTTYADGTKIITNYRDVSVSIGGVTVDAKSYKVVKEGRT